MRKKIGECLIEAGHITEDDLRTAVAEQKRTGERVGVVLVRLHLATETQVAEALAFQLGFPFVHLAENPPETAAVLLIPKELALRRLCVAVRLEQHALTVAMADPLQFGFVQDLATMTGYRIRQVVSTGGDIGDAIRSAYPDESPVRPARRAHSPTVSPSRGPDDAAQEPLADLACRIVKAAITSQATDVHVEPADDGVFIRHRLDGLLKEVMVLPARVHAGLVAQLKTMAGLDVAERRLPQRGRLRVTTDDGTGVDFRVSTLRTLFGEKVVLRLLDHGKGVPTLEEVGLSAASLEEVRFLLRHQQGMVLVVGPAGSGKTTTLGAALRVARSETTNIMTVEDPVEYDIPGVNQTEVNEPIGLTFASALRSIVAQDPDVVLVSEIRDTETAKVAIHAAQAGHLVLSSLRSWDAPSAVTRLGDLGVEPTAVASALVGVVAQRLVRRLCLHCRREYTPPADRLRLLRVSDADAPAIAFHEAVGCDQCSHTGYRGRTAVYEVMRVTDTLRRLIAAGAPEDAIREAAVAGGMITLGEDGMAKVKSGVTTDEELLRVVDEVRETRSLCRGCGTAVRVDFVACPNCGTRLGAGCPHCGRALQPGWNFCPYCSRAAQPTRQVRLAGDREPHQRGGELPARRVAEFKKN